MLSKHDVVMFWFSSHWTHSMFCSERQCGHRVSLLNHCETQDSQPSNCLQHFDKTTGERIISMQIMHVKVVFNVSFHLIVDTDSFTSFAEFSSWQEIATVFFMHCFKSWISSSISPIKQALILAATFISKIFMKLLQSESIISFYKGLLCIWFYLGIWTYQLASLCFVCFSGSLDWSSPCEHRKSSSHCFSKTPILKN